MTDERSALKQGVFFFKGIMEGRKRRAGGPGIAGCLMPPLRQGNDTIFRVFRQCDLER